MSVITVPEQEHGTELDLVLVQLLPATEGKISFAIITFTPYVFLRYEKMEVGISLIFKIIE